VFAPTLTKAAERARVIKSGTGKRGAREGGGSTVAAGVSRGENLGVYRYTDATLAPTNHPVVGAVVGVVGRPTPLERCGIVAAPTR